MKEKSLLAVTAFILLVASCSQQGAALLDEQVNIGTHKLHLYCLGKGSPTVVIDVGFAESYTDWLAIQEQVAQGTRVCTYDRAGYGQSEPGPMPRHSKQVADELKLLLETAGVKGPYLLVGHSLGGLNMQAFAVQYPNLVAGAVLLDPPPLRWILGERFPELHEIAQQETGGLSAAAEAADRSSDPDEKAKATFYRTLASEHAEMFSESAEQVRAIESFGDMPLLVLASGKPNPAFGDSAEAFRKFWNDQCRELATMSTRGTFILAEESGHHIHLDAPELVIDAIHRVSKQTTNSDD